ncbi:MAG TPA: hypothetical protein VL361_00825 [Candidatus Limnocylindrales bacterium]|nr:hypothetical protein [Candidatus Limnocylindrales bacterium]
MGKTDFLTAFSRLLRDGPLRDTYAREPQRALEILDIKNSEHAAFLAINPVDLEFQAEVLLHKRFDLVSRMIPQTVKNAGDQAWPWFAEYARACWPANENPALADTRGFCSYLARKHPSVVSTPEQNRVRFAAGKARVAIHIVPDLVFRRERRHGLQVFLRTTDGGWREFRLYFGL